MDAECWNCTNFYRFMRPMRYYTSHPQNFATISVSRLVAHPMIMLLEQNQMVRYRWHLTFVFSLLTTLLNPVEPESPPSKIHLLASCQICKLEPLQFSVSNTAHLANRPGSEPISFGKCTYGGGGGNCPHVQEAYISSLNDFDDGIYYIPFLQDVK